MSQALPFPDQGLVASAEAAGFRAVRDEYSVQIYHGLDRMFWVRVETAPADRVVVSDLTIGGCSAVDAALALGLAVEMADKAHMTGFRFRDVAPLPDTLERRLHELRAVLGALAKARSRFVAEWRVQSHDEKIDILAVVCR
jgi:hypothetical protein